MERLWRSKSAGNMREQFRQSEQENLPPVPSLPSQHAHANVRARLVSQANAAPPAPAAVPSRPMSPAAITPAVMSPAVPSPAITSPALSPPLALSPDLSSSALPSPSMSGSGALVRAPTQRSDIDDSILAQLDQKYPSFRACSPLPAMVHADDMDDDPFASAIDYSQPIRPRAPSRSPLPEFGVLPSPPLPDDQLGTPRNSPSFTNLKQSLVPRLRKSKSMGLVRRPSSILSAFRGGEGGRMSRGASPVPSPADRPSTPKRTPALDELVKMAMGQSPLAPPRPQFYDSFDLGDDDDEEEPKQPNAGPPGIPQLEPLERVESMDLSVSRAASPRPRKISTSQAPDLSFETAPSVSGSSIELVTPAVSRAPACGRMSPSQSSSEALEHHRVVQRDNTATPTSDLQEVYAHCLWQSTSEEALAHSLADKAHRRNENPPRDDRSETCPSTFGSQSWEAAIAAFPTIDDHVGVANAAYFDYDRDTGPGERESLASNVAVAPTDSCTHSLVEDSDTSSRPQFNRTHSAGKTAPSEPNSTMWTSWRDATRRSSGRSGSRGSSRGSSRDRRARTVDRALDGPESDSSSESEEDDVALGSLHPGAAAAQQQRLADQKKRREARRAARAARAAKKEAELRRSKSSASAAPRRPHEWNGEGVHPGVLAGQLERVAVSSKAPPIPSRALRPPPTERGDRSPMDTGTSLSRSTTLGRSSTGGHSVRSGASANGHRIASEGDAHPQAPRQRELQHRIASDGDARSAAVSRAVSTTNSAASSIAMRRPRAHSNASRSPLPAPPTEPTPVRRTVSVRCMVAQGSDVRSITLDAYPETMARDVLAAARQRGDIGEGNWVVFESFAELGLGELPHK